MFLSSKFEFKERMKIYLLSRIAFYSTTVLQKACSYAVQYYFLVCVFFTLSHLPNFIFRIYNTHNAKGRRQKEKNSNNNDYKNLNNSFEIKNKRRQNTLEC